MNNQEVVKCDLLVIGRGFSGMAAAAKASSAGLKTVHAGSSSNFFLVSGLIDLIGIYPIEKQKLIFTPKSGVRQLKKDIPGPPLFENRVFASA